MNKAGALVIVTSSFPIQGDGSEAAGAFVADFAEELAKHIPVRVVAPGYADGRETWSKDIEIFRFAAPTKPLSTLQPWRPADSMQILRVLRSGANATHRAAADGAVAHIFALWALPCGAWARSAARKHGIEYSVWTLGSDIWSLGRIPLVRTHLRRILRSAHFCYSDGMKLADDTRRIAGRAVEFLPSTRRTVRTRETPPRSAPPYRMLFLGRWHPNKGVDLLLEALGQLTDDDWKRLDRIEICGGGPLEPLVHERVDKLRAAGRPIERHGYLDKKGAEDAILRADYVLIPSRIESIPVVFSDAMKLGTPVIAMPVGDLPALLAQDGGCGILAADLDASAYCAALRSAFSTSAQVFDGAVRRQATRLDLAAIARRLLHQLAVT